MHVLVALLLRLNPNEKSELTVNDPLNDIIEHIGGREALEGMLPLYVYIAAITGSQELFVLALHETFGEAMVEILGDTIKFVSFSPGQRVVLQPGDVVRP